MWLANLGREPVGAGQRHVPGGNECQNTVWGCFWCNHALASDPVALITNSRYRMTLGVSCAKPPTTLASHGLATLHDMLYRDR